MRGSKIIQRAVALPRRAVRHRAPRPAPLRNDKSVTWSDRGVAAVCWATSITALAGSYRGLFDFATQRGQIPGWAAVAFPLYLDAFLVVGELRLYSAAKRGESLRIKSWSWLLTVTGLMASLAGNIAHVGPGASEAAKLAAAAAPLAAAVSLGTGLGIAKLNARKAGRAGREEPAHRPAAAPAAGTPARQPGNRHRPRADAPSAGQLATWVADDRLAGEDMSRRKFAARHQITDHYARIALAAGQNGHADLADVPS